MPAIKLARLLEGLKKYIYIYNCSSQFELVFLFLIAKVILRNTRVINWYRKPSASDAATLRRIREKQTPAFDGERGW